MISGESLGVEKAIEVAKEKGVRKSVLLPVSGAFHSPLMVRAGDQLFDAIRQIQFKKPVTPLIMNVTAAVVDDLNDLMGNLTMQVSRSVRWEETIQYMITQGVSAFLELGSSEVLTGLMKRISKESTALSISEYNDIEPKFSQMSAALGANS